MTDRRGRRIRRGTRALARTAAACALGLAALAGCSSPEPPPSEELAPTVRKQRMLFAADEALRRVLNDAAERIDSIRRDFDARCADAPRTMELAVSDPSLDAFGSPARQVRREKIEKIAELELARMNELLVHFEAAMWLVATEAGRFERGSSPAFRTGYQELDEKVDSMMLQLRRTADVEGLEQLATLRIYEHVELSRVLRQELEGEGVLSFFKSRPELGLFAPQQEGQATAFAFQRLGLAAPVPLSYVQAVRRRVERAGIVLVETEWRIDPATPNASGLVPLNKEVDDALYVTTEACIPAVDTRGDEFKSLFDHVLVSEYRTALRREDTGEILTTIGWQVRWNVDFRGTMRVLDDQEDVVVEHDAVLPALLQKTPPRG